MSLLLAGAQSRSLPQAAGVGSQPAARTLTPGPGPGLGAASGSTAGRSLVSQGINSSSSCSWLSSDIRCFPLKF